MNVLTYRMISHCDSGGLISNSRYAKNVIVSQMITVEDGPYVKTKDYKQLEQIVLGHY
jgi:hypothetical protein